MNNLSDSLLIDTPENVLLDAEIAGFGSRCVASIIDYINEKFASKRNAQLKKKLSKLSDDKFSLDSKIGTLQQAMKKPLVKVSGYRRG